MGRACQTGPCASPCCPVTVTTMAGVVGGTCNRTGGTLIGTISNCCPIALSESGSGPDSPYDAIDRYYDFAALTASKNILIVWDFFGVSGDRLTISAWNGTTCSLVFTNFGGVCTLGSGSATATIPAGTIRLYIGLEGCCNCPVSGAADLWSLTITCP